MNKRIILAVGAGVLAISGALGAAQFANAGTGHRSAAFSTFSACNHDRWEKYINTFQGDRVLGCVQRDVGWVYWIRW